MAPTKWKDASSAPKVEGRVRCHKCLMICSDAAHYLSHNCEPKPSDHRNSRGERMLRKPLFR